MRFRASESSVSEAWRARFHAWAVTFESNEVLVAYNGGMDDFSSQNSATTDAAPAPAASAAAPAPVALAPAAAPAPAAQPTVLVVEDDAAISDVTCSFLAQEGYACTPVFSGTEARLVLGAHRFDLVICDLMLPGLPGEDVVALVRAQGAMPVIVTSAKGTTSDKVALLRTGADDYLVKPFDLDELLARIEVQLRRVRDARLAPDAAAGTAPASGLAAPRSERALRFRAWIADEDTRTFTVDGAPVRLTRTEFDLVCALMRRPRKVFTKRELFAAAWREEPVVEEKTVNTHIGNIRAKLKGTGTEGYIETVWGIGFKLAE